MSKKSIKSPLAAAVGAAFATSLMGSGIANAAENPFSLSPLATGYQVADKGKEGKCGSEGKCGNKSEASSAAMEESSTETAGDSHKKMEGKCGAMEDKKPMEGKCGGNK